MVKQRVLFDAEKKSFYNSNLSIFVSVSRHLMPRLTSSDDGSRSPLTALVVDFVA